MSPEERVDQLIAESSDLISAAGLAEVRHYVAHGEYEIALEGLVLELIQAGERPSPFDYARWSALIVELGLQEESALVGDFWERFQAWAQSP